MGEIHSRVAFGCIRKWSPVYAAPGNAAWQPGGREQPPQGAHSMSRMGAQGSSGGFSSALLVRRFRRRNLGKGDVLQVAQDFPMTFAD